MTYSGCGQGFFPDLHVKRGIFAGFGDRAHHSHHDGCATNLARIIHVQGIQSTRCGGRTIDLVYA